MLPPAFFGFPALTTNREIRPLQNGKDVNDRNDLNGA
jgi:hypothetical protein